MFAKISFLRIPLIGLGVVLNFVGNRYLASYDYGLWIACLGILLIGISLLLSIVLRRQAVQEDRDQLVRSWAYVLGWQTTFFLGFLAFQGYAWRVGEVGQVNDLFDKVLLALWLSLIGLGIFWGIGTELGFRSGGKGHTVELIRVKASGAAWLGIGLFLGFLVCLNYAASKKSKAFDLSYFKTTRPGEVSLNAIAQLSDPIEVGAFFSRDSEVSGYVREYLSAIQERSELVKVDFYDKDFNPVEAESFRAGRNGQLILMRDKKRERIEIGDDLSSARKNLAKLDEKFQKALMELIAEKKIIYVIQGHGEMNWKKTSNSPFRSIDYLEKLLGLQNYRVRELALTNGRHTKVPQDASLVMIAGPSFGYSELSLKVIQQYVEEGGKLLVFLDIEFGGEEKEQLSPKNDLLTTWLKDIGIDYQKIYVANDRTFLRYSQKDLDHTFLATNNFSAHESVKNLTKNDQKMGLITFQSGHFQIKDNQKDWKITPTIRSLITAFNDLNGNFKFDEDKNEKRQSLPIAVSAEKGESRIFAFADATMISDPLIRNPGNQLAVTDTIKWLIGDLNFSGATESEEDVKIQHSKARDLFVFHGSIYFVPLMVLLIGYFATRRKKGTKS